MKPLIDKTGRYLTAPEHGTTVWVLDGETISVWLFIIDDVFSMAALQSGLLYDTKENCKRAFKLRRAAQAYRLAAMMANEKYKEFPSPVVHIVLDDQLDVVYSGLQLRDSIVWGCQLDAEAYAKEVSEELIIDLIKYGWI